MKITFPLVALALLAIGCTGETYCDYVAPTSPTGDAGVDVVGCWQGPGFYALGQDPTNLVVYQFTDQPVQEGSATRRFREIQTPSSLYSSGQVFLLPYRFVPPGGSTPEYQVTNNTDAGVLFLGGAGDNQGLFPAHYAITDTSLLLNFGEFQNPQPTYYFDRPQPLRRAVCTGFGFEEPADACPTPPTQ